MRATRAEASASPSESHSRRPAASRRAGRLQRAWGELASRAVAFGPGFGQGLLEAAGVPVGGVDLEPRGESCARNVPEMTGEVCRVAASAACARRAGVVERLEVCCQETVDAAPGVGRGACLGTTASGVAGFRSRSRLRAAVRDRPRDRGAVLEGVADT